MRKKIIMKLGTFQIIANVIVYEMGGLKVSDVYCGNDLADVQTAPILNKLHRLFYIRCCTSVLRLNKNKL